MPLAKRGRKDSLLLALGQSVRKSGFSDFMEIVALFLQASNWYILCKRHSDRLFRWTGEVPAVKNFRSIAPGIGYCTALREFHR